MANTAGPNKPSTKPKAQSAGALSPLSSDSDLDDFGKDIETSPDERDGDDDDGDHVMSDVDQPAASAPASQGKFHIPPKLLSRIVHDAFTPDNTRMTKEAMAALQIYVETFAKEAILRSNEERKKGSDGEGQTFLEVSRPEVQSRYCPSNGLLRGYSLRMIEQPSGIAR